MVKTLALLLGLVGSLSLGSGCTSQPALSPGSGYPVQQLSQAQVFSEGRLIGYLRHLEIQQPGAPVRFYRVETTTGGWVGSVDGYGRFYKRELHQTEPRQIGMFAMKEGLRRLFETNRPIRIVRSGAKNGAPVEASNRRQP